MLKLIVKAKNLNRRSSIPQSLPDPDSIVDVVGKGFTFEGEEVINVVNGDKWFKDKANRFYSGKGVTILDENSDGDIISPPIKAKIEQVINAFETGSAKGNYGALVTLEDYLDPETNSRIEQVTYGRSQTTEFGNLKILVKDYVINNGIYAKELKSYLINIGKKPSLAGNSEFCSLLIDAGNKDPIMKNCQDQLFEKRYYKPAHTWFLNNGFTLPLSMLVIYDSKIHSGGILDFLRRRVKMPLPININNEKEWILKYVDVRHDWLATHSNKLLRKTIYRTSCLKEQIQKGNWDLSGKVNANGVVIK